MWVPRLAGCLGGRGVEELGEALQPFVNQLALILVNRNKKPMALVPDSRGRSWIVDQSSHELGEIRRSRGSHRLRGQAGISRTSRKS